ncbi:MAG: 2,3,4,5-tetrahydropyridine-2,6-carboxylate N-succinyltransferase [Paludibacteraceae bacterium]|nr:2,3,4,5-tetrahydropyridine-2,6-carboxylate N-succinyltransferase [Paludibacteraceae bacterium]
MMKTKEELNNILSYEYDIYRKMLPSSLSGRIFAWFKGVQLLSLMSWIKSSRKMDYYKSKKDKSSNPLFSILYLYYARKYNHYSQKLNMEIPTEKIGKGLTIYHPTGIVVNSNAVIGDNCHFHGNNCVGNSGVDISACPVLGDNIMLGVGAKVIGAVRLANNIKVGAGAVVVSSFLEEGITIAGVPAKKIEKRG